MGKAILEALEKFCDFVETEEGAAWSVRVGGALALLMFIIVLPLIVSALLAVPI